MSKAAQRLGPGIRRFRVRWEQALQTLIMMSVTSFTGEAQTYLSLGDGARGDDVGCDSPGSVLDCHRVRQRVNAGLGNRHMGLERHASIVEGGADEDDPSSSAVG